MASWHKLLSGVRCTPILVAPLIAAAVVTSPAAAQPYPVVGRGDSSVIVNPSALDALGPPSSIGSVGGPEGLTPTPPAPGTVRPLGRTGTRAPAAAPPSRLLAVPALPGKPVPRIGNSQAAPEPRPQRHVTAREKPAAPPAAEAKAPPQQASEAPKPVAAAPAATPAQPLPPPPTPSPPPTPAETHAVPPPPVPVTPPAPSTTQPSESQPQPAAPSTASTVPPAPMPVPPAATPAATPAPAPAPTPEAAKPPAASPQTATVTPSSGSNRLTFESNSALLSDGGREVLDRLAQQMTGNEERLQVVAYAAAQGNGTSQARRLSLSRALAVRSYLIDKGIRSTRIDVRAMGTPESGNGPADRVDLVLVKP